MNFWDSSSILPLITHQKSSPEIWGFRERCTTIHVWTLTPIEVFSALSRLQRMGEIPSSIAEQAQANLPDIFRTFEMICDVDAVKARALRVLRMHPLKAADALQLAAALAACADNPPAHSFVTLDRVLAEAASREGFKIFPL